MVLRGSFSNVVDLRRNLHPVNKYRMGIALPIILAIEKRICLFFNYFIYLLIFFPNENKGPKRASFSAQIRKNGQIELYSVTN